MNVDRVPYLFIASMNVDPMTEDLFNEVYDSEHIPEALKVPGILGAARYRKTSLDISIGGTVQRLQNAFPLYSAVYGVESPDVLTSEEWARAVERGRWPQLVRPFTRDRQHLLLQCMSGNDLGPR